MQKEAELFASQVEEALDAILSGRKWKVKEELEDSLWGRTGTQLAKAEAVFLKKAEESLHEKEIVKGLISDMSHQTRTPIANMKLYMELLEEETLSENGSFFLTKMKEQMEKIDFLMQNMVKMSRLETGILQMHQENKRIYETIRRAIASLVPQAALKQIDLYVDCDETICFFHDSKWTEEAIYNILTMHQNTPNLAEASILKCKSRNCFIKSVFQILEKELRQKDRRRFLHDFIVSRKCMISRELELDSILQEK